MAHYDVTHACGHSSRVNLTGPHSTREWKLERMRLGQCSECWRAAEHAAAAEASAKAGLPAWTSGSPAQRAWAESVRVALLDKLDAEYTLIHARAEQSPSEAEPPDLLAQVFAVGRAALIEERTDAKWWIEHRDDHGLMLLREIARLAVLARPDLDPRPPAQRSAPTPKAPTPMPVPAPPPPTYIVRPDAPLTETIATVAYDPKTRRLTAVLPEIHDTFRATMRALDYTWDRVAVRWVRVLPTTAGDPLDRQAELAHALVAAGFVVRLRDAEAHARAVAGTFQPEQRRWVRLVPDGQYAGWLALRWPRSDDLYTAADRLRGARWREGRMLVPAGSADEIEEFAATYGFAISAKARAALDAVRESQAHGVVLSAPKSRARGSARMRVAMDRDVPPTLPVPDEVEIADALRDND